jgi:Fe-S-cluster containining protein
MSADPRSAPAARTPLPVVPLRAVPPGLAPDAVATADVELTIGGQPVHLDIAVPAGPTRPQDLLPVFRGMTDLVVGIAVQNTEREGKTISCRKGCGACCRQPVPVSESEALALAALVNRMPEPRQAQVRGRFAEALRRLEAAGLLDRIRDSDRVSDPELMALGHEYFNLGIPCPFLEDESCSIHPDRPLVCREFLVTSPAENCSHPTPDTVHRVPLPARPFRALRTLEGRAGSSPGWTTLVLALEHAERHPEGPAPRAGPAWLQEMFTHLSGRDEPAADAAEVAEVPGRVFVDNLRPLLTALGWVVGYGFGAGDWEAVSAAVRETDAAAGRWCEYTLAGGHRATVRMARDAGGGVQVRAEVPRNVEPPVRLAVALCQHFLLREPPSLVDDCSATVEWRPIREEGASALLPPSKRDFLDAVSPPSD